MVFAGMAVTLAGFLIAMLSVGVATSTGARLLMTLIGVTISMIGIIGVINRAYLKNAIWKR